MVREIKFRYVFERKSDCHIYMVIGDLKVLEQERSELRRMFENDMWKVIFRDQFIGLKCPDGSEIYEGDIVSVCKGGTRQTNPDIVEWDDFGWMPWLEGFCDSYMAVSDEKLVGNIHENPELLEVTDV